MRVDVRKISKHVTHPISTSWRQRSPPLGLRLPVDGHAPGTSQSGPFQHPAVFVAQGSPSRPPPPSAFEGYARTCATWRQICGDSKLLPAHSCYSPTLHNSNLHLLAQLLSWLLQEVSGHLGTDMVHGSAVWASGVQDLPLYYLAAAAL